MIGYSDKRVSNWLSQVGQSLAAGMSPSEAVALADGLGHKLSIELSSQFDQGLAWEVVLASSARFLSGSELAIMSAAEKSGGLPEALNELSKARKERAQMALRIKLAMLYPVTLLHFAALIVPIQYIFDMNFQAYALSLAMIILPLWGGGVVLGLAFKVWPSLRKAVMRMIPILGTYSKRRDIAVLSRTLSACIGAGIRIDHCWQSSIDAACNRKLDRLGKAVQAAIAGGRPASQALVGSSWICPAFAQFYKNGEMSGKLDTSMAQAADQFMKEAKTSLTLASILYPAIILAFAMGFAAFQVIRFYADYYDRITNIGM